jgi:peptidoglycan hydrolase-like protein with peptidoglycan-binding domain
LANPVLRQGSKGEDVRALQQKLGIRADGIFGPQTAQAVRDFQQRSGVGVDAIVGPKTWGALNATSETQRSGTDPTQNSRIQELNVPKYNISQVPLSANEIAAINEQRILAREAYENTLAGAMRNEALSRLAAQRRRETEKRLSGRVIDDKMQEYGGMGVATAPRFAGKFIRKAGEDLQLKYGEIETELGAQIAGLQQALVSAENEMERQLALLDATEARGRTSVDVLFPAARQYG